MEIPPADPVPRIPQHPSESCRLPAEARYILWNIVVSEKLERQLLKYKGKMVDRGHGKHAHARPLPSIEAGLRGLT